MCRMSETYAGGFETGACVGSGFTAPLMLGFKDSNKGHFLGLLSPPLLVAPYTRPEIFSLSPSRPPLALSPFSPFICWCPARPMIDSFPFRVCAVTS